MAGKAKEHGIAREVLLPRLVLMVSVLALVLIGLVMVYSSSFAAQIDAEANPVSSVIKQGAIALAGIVFAFILYRVLPIRFWRGNLTWLVWGVTMALVMLTAIAGTNLYGATRWLYIGGFSLQPSEFAKFALILATAKIIFDVQTGEYDFARGAVLMLVAVGIPVAGILGLQSDLGTTLIIAIGILAVMWFGGIPWYYIVAIMVVGGIVGIAAIFGTGYRSDRLIFLDPWADADDLGSQLIHSFYGFAEGGIFGVGLGNGAQKYSYLPMADSDFIYATIGEELGMVGAVVVIILFLLVLYSGMQIAHYANNSFSQILAGSLTVMLVFQAFLNIGCVTGMLPTTGKPLPFISSGGSSMLSSLIMVGLILGVSRESEQPDEFQRRRENLNIVWDPSSAQNRSKAFKAQPGGKPVKPKGKPAGNGKAVKASAPRRSGGRVDSASLRATSGKGRR